MLAALSVALVASAEPAMVLVGPTGRDNIPPGEGNAPLAPLDGELAVAARGRF